MAALGKRHVHAVRRLNNRLARLFGDVCLVDCQNPVILDPYSASQPDLLLVKFDLDQSGDIAQPEDVYLCIEVADSSVAFDSTNKLRAYARNGIPEYWIVNLVSFTVEVFRKPQGDVYIEQFRRQGQETVAPAAFPDREIVVADILG